MNMFLIGKWPGKKDKHMHINILKCGNSVEVCQKFIDDMRGKTISYHIDNSTRVAYLLKERDNHCKMLNGLERKFLLICHKNGKVVYPEYF